MFKSISSANNPLAIMTDMEIMNYMLNIESKKIYTVHLDAQVQKDATAC